MKFMKLGSKPDTFCTSEAVKSVSSEVSSDLIVQVQGSRFLLHKFPLLSKSLLLQKLCSENSDSQQPNIVQLPDFPGGFEAFELCAKFCYGITITLSAYNYVSARCAAEYLQMTEEVEKGNLVHKLEVFFTSCILLGWKDTIVTLQTTKPFHSWSEELGITSRCIEALAKKALARPTKTHLLRRAKDGPGPLKPICNGATETKCWWGEDLAELSIDLYWRTLVAIKSSGKVPGNIIGDALRLYASKWLPSISNVVGSERTDPENAAGSEPDRLDPTREVFSKFRLLLESIISLLPSDKCAVSCSFLLKLLKAANLVDASSSSKMELVRRVGIQLEEARVSDLLIKSKCPNNTTLYDVDLVMSILEQFKLLGQSPPTSPRRTKDGFERRRRSRSAENVGSEFEESRRSSSASHSSKVKVARLMDGYLQEIAKDANLPLTKFLEVAEGVPDFARFDHDDLYKAIDIYLKAHPNLNKSERKQLCRILDCKKLSMEACMHAAQNEMLPLRVVVQVLFFEQARGTAHGGQVTELPKNIKALLQANGGLGKPAEEDQWRASGLKTPNSKLSTLRMKLAEDEDLEDEMVKPHKLGAVCAFPSRPKRIFSKLWSMNRSASQRNC